MNNRTDPKNRQQREMRREWHTPVRARVAPPRVKTRDSLEGKLVDIMQVRYLCGRTHHCR